MTKKYFNERSKYFNERSKYVNLTRHLLAEIRVTTFYFIKIKSSFCHLHE